LISEPSITLPILVDYVIANMKDINTVVFATIENISEFRKIWSEKTNVRFELFDDEKLYKITKEDLIIPESTNTGTLEIASLDDFNLLLQYMLEFFNEIKFDTPKWEAESIIKKIYY